MVRKLQLLAWVLWLLNAGSASALTISEHVLGSVSPGRISLGSVVPPGDFLDVYTFALPSPMAMGAAVVPVPVDTDDLPVVELDAALVLIGLYSATDTPLAIDVNPADGLGVAAVLPTGVYKLAVLGVSTGVAGGLYGGALLLQAVPEPASAMLLTAGVLVLLRIRRRQP